MGFGGERSLHGSEREESELIVKAKGGDSRAFERLTKPRRDKLVSFCNRLLANREMAEDAAQDTIVSLWKVLHTFDGDGRNKFDSFVWSIAANICRNKVRTRKGKAEQRPLSLDDETVATAAEFMASHEPHRKVIEEISSSQLMRAILEHGESTDPPWDALDRQIFLVIYEGRINVFSEIARIVDKPRETVVYRYRTRIKSAVEMAYISLIQ